MGTVREPLAEGTERAPYLGLPKDIYTFINHYTDAKDIWDNVKMLLEGSESRECSVMVLEAMTGAFGQKKNQPTMHSWHSPPQVRPVLIMSHVFDCDEMFSSESDVRTFMPPKPDLVFHDAPTVNETVLTAFNVELIPTMSDKDFSQSNRPSAPLIKDWVSDSEDASKVTTAIPHNNVTRARPAKTVSTKQHSPPRRIINHRPTPQASNFHQIVTTVKAPHGNPQQALKDKGVIDSRSSRNMTWNMSYLTDFEEMNGGYVVFGSNPKGGKITVSQMYDKKNNVLFTDTKCIVLSSDFKLPDENHVLLRVPRENNMYNVDLKNIVPSGDLTFLFAKATLDESNL
nr:ribonuclease H-like domain-containing protein [Tanacetum cinerariifolium]